LRFANGSSVVMLLAILSVVALTAVAAMWFRSNRTTAPPPLTLKSSLNNVSVVLIVEPDSSAAIFPASGTLELRYSTADLLLPLEKRLHSLHVTTECGDSLRTNSLKVNGDMSTLSLSANVSANRATCERVPFPKQVCEQTFSKGPFGIRVPMGISCTTKMIETHRRSVSEEVFAISYALMPSETIERLIKIDGKREPARSQTTDFDRLLSDVDQTVQDYFATFAADRIKTGLDSFPTVSVQRMRLSSLALAPDGSIAMVVAISGQMSREDYSKARQEQMK